DLIEWAKYNRDLLAHHKVYATGTTGAALERELDFPVMRLESGTLGGDKALRRKAAVWDVAVACDRSTADFIISSPLMDSVYERIVPDYSEYRNRKVAGQEPEIVPPVKTVAGLA